MHFLSKTTAAAALMAIPTVSANLNQLAKAAGKLYFGSATDNGELSDAAYVAILKNGDEFGQITPGNGQKWQFIEPQPGKFDFAAGDVVTDFARQNKQLLRCHTTVWHSQLPSWVSSGTWTPAQLTSVIQTHIANEMAHYKGQCYSWDVVNEALNDDGTFRDSVFHKVLGTDFIPLAFKAAAAADPDAKLYYNDFNIENTGAKQKAAVGIVQLVKAAGAPLHGVGMQSHFTVGGTPSQATLESTMKAYLAAGASEVAFTELDIRFNSLPASASGLQQQAQDYGSVTKACLAVAQCVGITIWDFTDKYSWIPSTFPGTGGACLFDENFSKKPAYTTVADILAAAATAPVGATATASAVTVSTTATAKATTLATSVRASSTTAAAAPAATAKAPVVAVAKHYEQCGGNNFSGPTACASGFTCKKFNDWYSQCI